MDKLLGVYPVNGSIEIVVHGFLHAKSLKADLSPSLFREFTLIFHHPFRYFAAKATAKWAAAVFKERLSALLAQQTLENASMAPQDIGFLAKTLARGVSLNLSSGPHNLHVNLDVKAANIVGNTCFILLSITVKDPYYSKSLMGEVYPIPWVVFEKLLTIDLQPAWKQHG